MGIFDLSGQRLLFGLAAMLVIVSTHGFFLTLFARLLGDRGPEQDKRLTLNPLSHVEIIGAFALVLTPFGWIKPVTLTPSSLRGVFWGTIGVILLSLTAMLALAWGLWALRPLVYGLLPANAFGTALIGILELTARRAVTFSLFNLLPVLPLTAGLVWAALAPRFHAKMMRYTLFIAAGLAVLILTGVPAELLRPPAAILGGFLFP